MDSILMAVITVLLLAVAYLITVIRDLKDKIKLYREDRKQDFTRYTTARRKNGRRN